LLAIAAAMAGIAAMAAGLLWHFDDGRAPGANATASAADSAPRTELVRHLERSPRDDRSWALLARMDFDADRFADAATAYERALAIDAKVARDPAVWCEYADALGMTQGGSLAGKPRELVLRALARSPRHPKALEMAGSAAFEAGEFASAAGYWRQLQGQLEAGSHQYRELAAAIARAEEMEPASAAHADIAAVAK
jgi:cytochrome c-type biogenesis protein CcmH